MLQSAGLAEVVPAPGGHGTGSTRRFERDVLLLRDRGLLGDDGVLEGLPADEALEGQVLIVAAHLVVLVV